MAKDATEELKGALEQAYQKELRAFRNRWARMALDYVKNQHITFTDALHSPYYAFERQDAITGKTGVPGAVSELIQQVEKEKKKSSPSPSEATVRMLDSFVTDLNLRAQQDAKSLLAMTVDTTEQVNAVNCYLIYQIINNNYNTFRSQAAAGSISQGISMPTGDKSKDEVNFYNFAKQAADALDTNLAELLFQSDRGVIDAISHPGVNEAVLSYLQSHQPNADGVIPFDAQDFNRAIKQGVAKKTPGIKRLSPEEHYQRIRNDKCEDIASRLYTGNGDGVTKKRQVMALALDESCLSLNELSEQDDLILACLKAEIETDPKVTSAKTIVGGALRRLPSHKETELGKYKEKLKDWAKDKAKASPKDQKSIELINAAEAFVENATHKANLERLRKATKALLGTGAAESELPVANIIRLAHADDTPETSQRRLADLQKLSDDLQTGIGRGRESEQIRVIREKLQSSTLSAEDKAGLVKQTHDLKHSLLDAMPVRQRAAHAATKDESSELGKLVAMARKLERGIEESMPLEDRLKMRRGELLPPAQSQTLAAPTVSSAMPNSTSLSASSLPPSGRQQPAAAKPAEPATMLSQIEAGPNLRRVPTDKRAKAISAAELPTRQAPQQDEPASPTTAHPAPQRQMPIRTAAAPVTQSTTARFAGEHGDNQASRRAPATAYGVASGGHERSSYTPPPSYAQQTPPPSYAPARAGIDPGYGMVTGAATMACMGAVLMCIPTPITFVMGLGMLFAGACMSMAGNAVGSATPPAAPQNAEMNARLDRLEERLAELARMIDALSRRAEPGQASQRERGSGLAQSTTTQGTVVNSAAQDTSRLDGIDNQLRTLSASIAALAQRFETLAPNTALAATAATAAAALNTTPTAIVVDTNQRPQAPPQPPSSAASQDRTVRRGAKLPAETMNAEEAKKLEAIRLKVKEGGVPSPSEARLLAADHHKAKILNISH
jgi:hypothetical protein